ncbi:MAG TPA: hypothetical protein PKX92_09835 [Edaphocola sp.]|nr:hypothetical protein [Edaphocola sp.]
MSVYLRNFLRFLFLVGIQVLLLNTLSLHWFSGSESFPTFIPYIYPLFLLLLPIETPVWFMLVSGFILGLTVDVFMNTPGLNAAASLLMAYCRLPLLKFILPKKLYEYRNAAPSVATMNWTPFLIYAALLLFIHHIALMFLEVWSLKAPLYFIIKLVASLITSLIFVVLYALLFSKQINNSSRGD